VEMVLVNGRIAYQRKGMDLAVIEDRVTQGPEEVY